MENSKYIKMWEARIEEIKEMGNCMNGNTHAPSKFFSEGGKAPYQPAEMIAYCDRMIKQLKEAEK